MGLIKNTHFEPAPVEECDAGTDLASSIARLDESDPAVRRLAARDLIAYPEAAQALVDRLQIETERSVREFILTSLTRIGGTIAVTGLVAWLRSEDATMRNEAIEAMKSLPDDVVPIMENLLKDGDSDVRIMAVNILESLRHPHVEAWLIDVIERDSVINVCGTAIDLLGEVGTQNSFEALQAIKLRYSAEPYIQFAADLALKRIAKG